MSSPALPFACRRGWREASDLRRGLVWSFPLLLLFWAALPHLTTYDTAALNDLTAYAGGFVFYAVARVIRPHQGHDVERILRHGFAGVAMSCATNAFVVAAFSGDAQNPSSYRPLFVATLGLLTTVPWGVVSCIVRACTQPTQQYYWVPSTTPAPASTSATNGRFPTT